MNGASTGETSNERVIIMSDAGISVDIVLYIYSNGGHINGSEDGRDAYHYK